MSVNVSLGANMKIIGEAGGTVWERTSALRWKQRGTPFLDSLKGDIVTPGPILEQAWVCRETGETEWRIVPTEP